MPRLRYEGTRAIRLWDSRVCRPLDVVEVTEAQARELLAVHPETIERRARGGKIEAVPHPFAGKPVRPGWAEEKPKPKAKSKAKPDGE